MKYEAVAQFTVTGNLKVRGVRNLLDMYGIDYAILESSGTGVLSTLVCEFVILKPEPTEITPDRLFSFMMKFDEMVRIGNSTHALTPAQIDFAKSCDKAKMLKFLDDIWYRVKVSYVKIIAMLAQAYSIAYDKPESNPDEKHEAEGTNCSMVEEAFAKLAELNDLIPEELLNELRNGKYTTTDMDKKGENKS